MSYDCYNTRRHPLYKIVRQSIRTANRSFAFAIGFIQFGAMGAQRPGDRA
jgi:hypothetical protein